MIDTNAPTYPELATRAGLRDRALRVEPLAAGWWEVEWRSGRITTYDRDPRDHLSLGYEPRRRGDGGPPLPDSWSVRGPKPSARPETDRSLWRSFWRSLQASSLADP
jgi:hypothetical protein